MIFTGLPSIRAGLDLTPTGLSWVQDAYTLVFGGALTDWISWRAAFLVNVPIAIVMIVGARAVLVETPRQGGRFDVVGAPSPRSAWAPWSSGSSSPA